MLKLVNGTAKRDKQLITLPKLILHSGEILGLTGPSGCGKSTLAMVLAGMHPLHSGSLSQSPSKLRIATLEPAIEPIITKHNPNSVQWICQQPEFAFNPRWSLERSLTESHPIDTKQLARYKIDPSWLKRFPSELSGGELQRLNLVRALAPTTKYLLCDEITAQLDPLTQRDIWLALCEEVGQRQLGLLVISHDDDLLNAVCDRVICFNE
ncbi:ATP-binding cassette domain-containing protein [Moritella dasanensis]|uniref:ATP-binding cassette domain-containing protein n=1 Tax=Moritella dasanensis TaxID=428031 RepID=UPI0002E3FBCC|nr:ATP-binding cassette domain-containing protein [Moritella dasanensis]